MCTTLYLLTCELGQSPAFGQKRYGWHFSSIMNGLCIFLAGLILISGCSFGGCVFSVMKYIFLILYLKKFYSQCKVDVNWYP